MIKPRIMKMLYTYITDKKVSNFEKDIFVYGSVIKKN